MPIYLEAREDELRPKSYREAKRYLERSWKPLHDLPIVAITRASIITLIDKLASSAKVACR